jgi:hemerythrin superfamily protein
MKGEFTMDATRLLEKDHAALRTLSKQYEKAGDRAFSTKARIVASMKAELDAHMAIEEEIFYPAMKAARSKDARESVREGVEEHTIIKRLLGELDEIKPEDEQYDAKVKVLSDTVEHHAGEEEKEMFVEARKLLSKERREELGEHMEKRKESLLAVDSD